MAEHLGMALFIISVGMLALNLLLRRSRTSADSGTIAINAEAEHAPATDVTLWVRVGVTSLLLVAALFVILSNRYPADQQKWAYGVVGTILGYWLKG